MTRTPAEKEAKLRLFYRRQIEDLHRRGTLFAWHLFLDAVKVFPRSGVGLVPKLGAPAPYTEAESEIRALTELGATAIDECRKSTPSVVFELGILYSGLPRCCDGRVAANAGALHIFAIRPLSTATLLTL